MDRPSVSPSHTGLVSRSELAFRAEFVRHRLLGSLGVLSPSRSRIFHGLAFDWKDGFSSSENMELGPAFDWHTTFSSTENMELLFPSAKVMVMLMVMLMNRMMMLYSMVHEHIRISKFDGYQFPNLVIWFPVVFDPR